LLGRLGRSDHFSALGWLASHGCDAEAALSEAEDLIRSYQDSSARAAILAWRACTASHERRVFAGKSSTNGRGAEVTGTASIAAGLNYCHEMQGGVIANAG
jgi:hypothetical protein